MHIAIGYRWFETAAGYHLERALCSLGHTVTYVGLPSAQRSGYDPSIPLPSILTALPKSPDLFLWVDPAGRYFPMGIEDCPIPTAGYLIDVHLGRWRKQAARFFDAVFVAQLDYVAGFKHATGHDQVRWLPLAAPPDVHRQLDRLRDLDVGFVGNLAPAHRKTARARRLQLIAQRFRTNDFYRRYAAQEMSETYCQAKIVFNTSISGDVTMRIFEGTACGAQLLTDSIANGLDQLFEIGKEIVVYQDDQDLLDKIDYYLAHDDERERIAHAGQQRTLAQHMYRHRAQQLLDVINAPSFRRAAPLRAADRATRLKARLDIYTHLHMLDAVFDETGAAGYHPIRRAWASLPCLSRRIVL
jgi:glycosyltransferase involved in cell wall biosynthesis